MQFKPAKEESKSIMKFLENVENVLFFVISSLIRVLVFQICLSRV